ncbi:MAG: serpin family protein [Candidatus Cloacimonetes bacterium]|nr:serpin family protein [Candidatus Cloacimonadota bacterium]
MKIIIISIVLLLILCSCTDKATPENNITDGDADWHASKVDLSVIEANTAFALDILKKLNGTEDENIFFSPLSLSIALSMTLIGAAGNTLAQMQDVLHFSDYTVAELNEQNQHLIRSLIDVDPSIDLGLANSIWIKQNFPVKEDFILVNEAYYESQVFPDLPFNDDTVIAINNWAEVQTNGRITDLVENIDPSEVLFLINAIYFCADWTYSFNPDNTENDLFITADEIVVAPFMQSDGLDFTYLWDEDFSAARLPYGNEDMAMYIFLPDYNIGLSDWIQNLDYDTLNDWFSGFAPLPENLEDGISFQLPSFTVSYNKCYEQILSELGMVDAFSSAADLSELTDNSEELFISKVKQNAWITVNEAGTEAAGATLVGISFETIEYSFIAYRPFLYLIRDDRNGTILFIGIMHDPSQEQ